MNLDIVVGPQASADGSQLSDRLRTGLNRELVVTDLHARFYEQAARGQLFSLSTALAGTTLVAANVAPPAAAAATVLSLFNPPGSGVAFEVLLAWIMHISGTPAAGAWAWCAAQALGSTKITAAQNAIPANNRTPGPNAKGQGYTQTALTGGPLHVQGRLYPTAQFAGAIAATTPGQVAIDAVDGALVVQPGGVITLAPPGIGTTHIVAAGIMYAEAPGIPNV